MKNLILIILFITISCKQKSVDVAPGINEELVSENQSNEDSSIEIPTINKPDGKIKNVTQGCGYNYNFDEGDLDIYLPNNREKDIINKILYYSGIPSNFEVYKANIKNAVALIVNDKRYIIYDSNLLEITDKSTNTYWSSISILAHEIGHHLSGHTMGSDNNALNAELDADKFSGFILYKMGASIENAISAISLLGSPTDSETHPSKSKRIAAIENGWNEAYRQRYDGATPPPPNDDNEDFYVFDSPMLINREHIETAIEYGLDYYTKNNFLYGIVTEVDKNFDNFSIKIMRMENVDDYWIDLTGKEKDVVMDAVGFLEKNEMCHSCAFNFKALIVPGRRLKFAMVEGYPDAGTNMNGVWFLTYAERLKSNEL